MQDHIMYSLSLTLKMWLNNYLNDSLTIIDFLQACFYILPEKIILHVTFQRFFRRLHVVPSVLLQSTLKYAPLMG